MPLTTDEIALLEELDKIEAGEAAAPLAQTLLDIARETKRRLHDDAKRNGRTAQHNRAIDASRKGADRLTYNLQRRVDYATAVQEVGRNVRPYGAADDEAKRQKRREQNAAAKARHLANRTPEQIEADKAKDAARQRAKRSGET